MRALPFFQRGSFLVALLIGTAWGLAAWALPGRVNLLPSLPDLDEPGMRNDVCNTCHTSGGGTPRNPFGLDWQRTYSDFRDLGMSAAQAFAPLADGDSDRDGFSNEQELLLGTHPGNAQSRPVRVVLHLSAGWNAIGLPVDLRRTVRLSELVTELGEGVEQVIRYDSGARRFVPLPEAGDPILDGDEGLFVRVREAVSVEWVGRPWKSRASLTLQPGLQLIVWPTLPTGAQWLSQLLEPGELGVTLVHPAPRWRAFRSGLPERQPPDAPLRLGAAYLLLIRRERTVSLSGTVPSFELELSSP